MTDVHFHTSQQQINPNMEQTEMAAFEKGRMQGEMEAIRRMEAEASTVQLKQFPDAHPVANLQRPDVVEINRLTWLQRAAAFLGEATAISYLVIGIVWLVDYRGDMGWSDDVGGDSVGNQRMWNTHFLCSILGLICHSQAILMYRVLPLNTNANINRAIYCFFQLSAITLYTLSLAANIKTQPDWTFWGVADWCFVTAMFVFVTHSFYSMFRTCTERAHPVDYENWAEVNNRVTLESAEQRRDHSTFNQAGRSVYTPAPVWVARTSATVPPANANLGAEVPVAPANAPRWAENPNTHSEDYFLLPRAKWGVTGFVAMGAAILMFIASIENIIASGRQNWAQGQWAGNASRYEDINGIHQNGVEARLLGALGVLMLLSVLFITYAAMPPRTTLVKNGILVDNNRRTSVSHNAETRLGNIV